MKIKIDKYLDLVRELKKIVEHEGDGDTNCSWCAWNGLQKIEKRLEELDIRERIETILTRALLRSTRIP